MVGKKWNYRASYESIEYPTVSAPDWINALNLEPGRKPGNGGSSFGKSSFVGDNVMANLTRTKEPIDIGFATADPQPSTESILTMALHRAFEQGSPSPAAKEESIETTVPIMRHVPTGTILSGSRAEIGTDL